MEFHGQAHDPFLVLNRALARVERNLAEAYNTHSSPPRIMAGSSAKADKKGRQDKLRPMRLFLKIEKILAQIHHHR